MVRKVFSATVAGIHSVPVVIEVDSSLGLPGFSMVGLPDSAVRESRERVVSALRSSGFQPMSRRITVNLAPADIRKEGSAFDLALAVGLLLATEQFECNQASDVLMIGELSLDGNVQPIRGVLSMALCAHKLGKRLIVPLANAEEALAVDGLDVMGVNSLVDCLEGLAGNVSGSFRKGGNQVKTPSLQSVSCPDFSGVQGMLGVRRALEIVAVGWHHFLMVGSPGAGKTMCAQCLPGILPPMFPQEAIETTMIHSCSGNLQAGGGLLEKRPFRAPHHTASSVSLVGGGRNPRPGEISLAHNGLLFLDEFPEFSRASIEGLRQPLEAGEVTVARAQETITWPARFLLGAAMNPCPCGYSLDPSRECGCAPGDVTRYRSRISGPMLDRIDLQIQVPIQPFDLLRVSSGESSATIAERVQRALAWQKLRFEGNSQWVWNSQLSGDLLRAHCRLGTEEEALLKQAANRLKLSTRGVFRVLKVARTIADLRMGEVIKKEDIAEAVQYRLL
jgi:magnesium chelatase family protein